MWHSPAAAVKQSPQKLDLVLTARLREVVSGESAAESELHEAMRHYLAAREWKYVQQYADAKTGVVEEILARTGAPAREL